MQSTVYNYHNTKPIYKEVPNQQELISWLKSQAKPPLNSLQRHEKSKPAPKVQITEIFAWASTTTNNFDLRGLDARHRANT